MDAPNEKRFSSILERINKAAEEYWALDASSRMGSAECFKLLDLLGQWEGKLCPPRSYEDSFYEGPFYIASGKKTTHDAYQDAYLELLKNPPDPASCKFTTALVNRACFRSIDLEKKRMERESKTVSFDVVPDDYEDEDSAPEENYEIYEADLKSGRLNEEQIEETLDADQTLNLADLIFQLKKAGRLIPTYVFFYTKEIINYSRMQKRLFDNEGFCRLTRPLDAGFCAKMTTSESGVFSTNREMCDAELSEYAYENALVEKEKGVRDTLLDKAVADYEGIHKSVLSKRLSSFHELIKREYYAR